MAINIAVGIYLSNGCMRVNPLLRHHHYNKILALLNTFSPRTYNFYLPHFP